MRSLCFRCDWEGEAAGSTCPRCRAPLFHPAPPRPPRRAAAPKRCAIPTTHRSGRRGAGVEADPEPNLDVRVPTSVRAVVWTVVAIVGAVAVALAGGTERGRGSRSPFTAAGPSGIVVYAASDGAGAARLWLWHVATDEVTRGPAVPEPLELVSVGSPASGRIAFTSRAPGGTTEVAILDSLGPGARPRVVGRGDLVAWADDGDTAILVRRGPLEGTCRRRVSIAAVHPDTRGGERVLDDAICGKVLAVARTSLGYALTIARRWSADVVDADLIGAGYRDAGLLLADHRLIGVAPDGEMLVTSVAGMRPSADGTGWPSGPVSSFRQFGGRPVPYTAGRDRLRVDRILAYAPGSTRALALGGLASGELDGLWELPLQPSGEADRQARFVGAASGPVAATYGADGTGYVVIGGRIWTIRAHRLVFARSPVGAAVPDGPLVWLPWEPPREA